MIDEIETVDRTISSLRIAVERKRRRWKLLREELGKNEKRIFDEMMSI